MTLDHIVGRTREKFRKAALFFPKKAVDYLIENEEHWLHERLFDYFSAKGAGSWSVLDLPNRPERFEDLMGLFNHHIWNRGLIRQDLDEAAALWRHVSNLEGPRCLEIGRFRGGTTFLLGALAGSRGQVVSIDIADIGDRELLDALRRCGLEERVVLLVGDSKQIELEGEFDVIFVDGDHRYESVLADHNRWVGSLKVGGLAIYHNMAIARPTATSVPGVRRLRQQILEQQKYLSLCEEVGSLSVFKRLPGQWRDLTP